MLQRRPRSKLFPYTTLFRSARCRRRRPDYNRRNHLCRMELAVVLKRPRRVKRERELAPGPQDRRIEEGRARRRVARGAAVRSEEHTSELQSRENLVCRLLLE